MRRLRRYPFCIDGVNTRSFIPRARDLECELSNSRIARPSFYIALRTRWCLLADHMTRFVNLHYLLDWHTTPPLLLIAPSTLDTFNDTGGSHQPRGNTRRQQCRQHLLRSSRRHCLSASFASRHIPSRVGSSAGGKTGSDDLGTSFLIAESSALCGAVERFGKKSKEDNDMYVRICMYTFLIRKTSVTDKTHERDVLACLLGWLRQTASQHTYHSFIHSFTHSFIHPSVHRPSPVTRHPLHTSAKAQEHAMQLTYSPIPSFIHQS